jgi:V-type H+-transporting ATPase subunit F
MYKPIKKIAEQYLRPLINTYQGIIPTILEIPSKDHPYDPKKDTIIQKAAKQLYGQQGLE